MSRFSVLCFCLGLVMWPKDFLAQDPLKNILIVFGANETRPAYGRILEGVKRTFPADSAVSINVISEYLNLERFSDSTTIHQLVNLYNEKIREDIIDLVITVAPGAYDVLRKFNLELLRDVPVINLELSPKDPQDYLPDSRVVELQIDWSPGRSMAHAFELFPNHKHAYIIGGCAESDRMFLSAFEADTAEFSDTHKFTFLRCTTMDAILDTVEQLRDGSLVFLASYSFDADTTPYSTAIVLRFVASHSVSPVFTMSDNFIDYGGVGGRIVSFLEVGRETGRIAKDLLKETPGVGFSKITKSFYRYEYNWKELEKWGILDSPVIPRESTFFYKEFDFLDEYRWQLIGVLILIIIETILIYYLIRLVRSQKKVTAQKLQNEKLYRQLLREERITTMSMLTASLAHELNQPLSAILFNAQAGMRFLQSGKLNEEQAGSILKDIGEDVKRASGIISSVRSMMKMGTREIKNVEVQKLVRDVLNVLHTELNQHKVKVDVKESDQPLTVRGDEVELQQVLINLILNAVRAMKSNPPEDKLIQIKVYTSNNHLELSISDSGPGFPDSLEGKLFDPFVSTESDGMGIGLVLCKSIIQRHEGEIRAINHRERGAEFLFTLPLIHPGL